MVPSHLPNHKCHILPRTNCSESQWQFGKPLQWRHNGRDGVSITNSTIVYSTTYSGADKRKQQSSTSLTLLAEFPAQRPVTRKMFPFDEGIIRSPWSVINTLSPCDAKCQQKYWSTTAPIMLCFLTAPSSHYVIQCWLKCTVPSRYIAVIFLGITLERHPIARP